MESIPTKQNTIALVAEGGGMRGIFTAGVLDAFFNNNFDPFGLYIGVSAGACNLSSHIAGQYRRNHRIFTKLMTRPDFISIRKFISGGHLMDLDWLWDAIDSEDPLDVPSVISNLKRAGKEMIIVSTSVETGKPVYTSPTEATLNTILKASSSVPLFYRNFVECNGERSIDGGVSDPIPVEEAWRRGAKTIVVIRTRPVDFEKKRGMESAVVAFALRKFTGLRRAILSSAETYQRSVHFISKPPGDVKIFHIAPTKDLQTKRTSQNISSLVADYEQGVNAGRRLVVDFLGRC
jgi:predicted patatin/cPLA2 family phospholipase